MDFDLQPRPYIANAQDPSRSLPIPLDKVTTSGPASAIAAPVFPPHESQRLAGYDSK